jgi:hypothetical protein
MSDTYLTVWIHGMCHGSYIVPGVIIYVYADVMLLYIIWLLYDTENNSRRTTGSYTYIIIYLAPNINL